MTSPATAAAADILSVDLGARSYDIHIGSGLIERAGALMLPVMNGRRAFVVTDDNVAPLYLPRLKAALEAAGIAHAEAVLPAGEGTKDFRHLEVLLDAMLAARCERSTMVVALGGGVIGDLTGFAASVCLRGLDFVQIPTTLLAQVDSSVGGKTGINTARGKNLVGSFHQPRLVLADIGALDTLDHRQVLAGYAEVAKYGAIDDPAFFAWLEEHGPAVVAGGAEARRYAVATSCRAKARIVGADEREGGIRALLNLGHTFGHALEAEVGFSDEILHGEAVAIGMVLAARLSARLGHAPMADAQRLAALLHALDLPTQPPPGLDADALLAAMRLDKKNRAGTLRLILWRGAGQAFIATDVDAGHVRAAWSC